MLIALRVQHFPNPDTSIVGGLSNSHLINSTKCLSMSSFCMRNSFTAIWYFPGLYWWKLPVRWANFTALRAWIGFLSLIWLAIIYLGEVARTKLRLILKFHQGRGVFFLVLRPAILFNRCYWKWLFALLQIIIVIIWVSFCETIKQLILLTWANRSTRTLIERWVSNKPISR